MYEPVPPRPAPVLTLDSQKIKAFESSELPRHALIIYRYHQSAGILTCDGIVTR